MQTCLHVYMLQLPVENPLPMKSLSVKVDENFLRRINKAREWRHQTQEQFMKAALETEMKPYKAQLDEWERAEERILRKLPALNQTS